MEKLFSIITGGSKKCDFSKVFKITCSISLLFLIILLKIDSINAAELHVGSGQTYSTIASAISASNSGDTIIIHPGTYNEFYIVPKSNTTIKGADGEARPVIDGQFTSRCQGSIPDGSSPAYGTPSACDNYDIFIFYQRHDITLRHLDIRDGGGYGAVTLMGAGAYNITIEECKISVTGWSSYAVDNAGCIYSAEGSAKGLVVKNNEIVSSISGVKGIIIFPSDGSELIEHNDIAISGDGSGGKDCIGIFWKHGLTSTYQAVTQHNIIHVIGSANGGIWADNDKVKIHNNLVYGSTPYQFGIKVHGGDMGGSPAGNDCIITHNTSYGARMNGVLVGGMDNTFRNNIFYGVRTEYQSFALWVYGAEGCNHNTISDYNCYYNSASSTPVKECRTNNYSLADWTSHSGQDQNSIQEVPGFANVSGNMNTIADFEIISGGANNGASDGKDMGVDISLVGIQTGVGPPSAPTSLRIVD